MKQILLVLLLLAVWSIPQAKEQPLLKDQIQRMAQRHGFSLRGLELLGETPARKAGGALEDKLKGLLAGYSYMLIAPPDSGPERLIVLGENQSLPPLKQGIEIVVPTERKGSHHLVEAMLRGETGREIKQQLMVDTGATFVVLPQSLSGPLGMNLQALEERAIQTARGKVQARVGSLRAMRLGAEELFDVDVAFIEDRHLGGQALLGMSVLNRYRVTLDDRENSLILDGQDD